MKLIKIFTLLIILLSSSCKINEQIFGSQEKSNFFIKDLKFEDYSIEKVYVVFNLYNTLGETANCSVKISLYIRNELVSEKKYYIGNIKGVSAKKIRILIDMPRGETIVNVEPLCKTNQIKKEVEIQDLEQQSQPEEKSELDIEKFIFVEDLELKGDGSESYLIFNLNNTLNKNVNCSAKAIIIKDNKTISEEIKYIGIIEGNSIKSDKIPVKIPQGKSLLDVIPLCIINKK